MTKRIRKGLLSGIVLMTRSQAFSGNAEGKNHIGGILESQKINSKD